MVAPWLTNDDGDKEQKLWSGTYDRLSWWVRIIMTVTKNIIYSWHGLGWLHELTVGLHGINIVVLASSSFSWCALVRMHRDGGKEH